MKIEAGTIIRTAVLALALINQLLTATGHPIIPIEVETVNQLVTAVFTVVTALVAWWKNNSYTKYALAADAELKELKKLKKAK